MAGTIEKYRLVGLKSIEFGDPDTDLDNAVEVGKIEPDSCKLSFPLPEVTNLYCEGEDDPDVQIKSGKSEKIIEFNCRDIKPANMVLAFGGSVVSTIEKTITASTIAFVDNGASPDTITDSGNGFVAAGFEQGMKITVSGSDNNDGNYTIATVAAGALTLIASDKVSDESAGESITIVSGGQGWSAPDSVVITKKSVRLKSDFVDGYRQVVTIKKASIRAGFDGKLISTDSGLINFNITIMKPASGSALTILPEKES